MGGDAFRGVRLPGDVTITTPRMHKQEYTHLREVYLKRLREAFPEQKVATLPELPEKADYGDVDFIVSSSGQDVDFEALANVLGAFAVIKGNGGCHLACLIDGSKSPQPAITLAPPTGRKLTSEKDLRVDSRRFAQIDIALVQDKYYDWHIFSIGHGGLGVVLGRLARSAGFRIDNKGLYLRLPAFDVAKSRQYLMIPADKGRILLSENAWQIVDFLGLATRQLEIGFETLQDMFLWLSNCKFISTELGESDRELSSPKLTIGSTYFQQWLPQHIAQERDANSAWFRDLRATADMPPNETRMTWLNEALAYFDRHAEYEECCKALDIHVQNATTDHLMKPIIVRCTGRPEGRPATEIARAMRRWVGVSNHELRILTEPQPDQASQLRGLLADDLLSLHDLPGVETWISQNWQQVRERERVYVKQKQKPACSSSVS